VKLLAALLCVALTCCGSAPKPKQEPWTSFQVNGTLVEKDSSPSYSLFVAVGDSMMRLEVKPQFFFQLPRGICITIRGEARGQHPKASFRNLTLSAPCAGFRRSDDSIKSAAMRSE
jgi:hypothetical protein